MTASSSNPVAERSIGCCIACDVTKREPPWTGSSAGDDVAAMPRRARSATGRAIVAIARLTRAPDNPGICAKQASGSASAQRSPRGTR